MLTPQERLIRIRKVLGLTQRDLAEEFQVSASAVGSWENHGREIPGPVLKLLEIYESELFPNEGEVVSSHALTEDLVDAIQSTARITDAEILGRLHRALSTYVEESKSQTRMGRKVKMMALRRLIDSIGDARGLPMKVAQVASYLDLSLPGEMREIFESLQQRGRALSFQTVESILLEEFDRTPGEMFQEFSRKPIATASIGQVHRARLHDGTWVAVKVQSPAIQDEINANFCNSDFIAQLELFIGPGSVDTKALVRDFYRAILRECDYKAEAETQTAMRGFFTGDPEIFIPNVHFTHSSRRVLTTDWVDGLNWFDFKKSAPQADRDRASRTISRFFAEGTFKHGHMHTDPQPGNYIFLEGRVAFLDFGRVRKLHPETLHDLHRFHCLLVTGDSEAARSFVMTTPLFKLNPSFDFSRFWEIVSQITRHLRQDSNVTFSEEHGLRHRALLRELGSSRMLSVNPDFFWAALFTHNLLIRGRADLCASGNWRAILGVN